MENQITAEHLSFHYMDEGGNAASPEILKDLSLTFEPGSFTAVLGHNGCGKSTLAKHMNAILLPTGGKMWISGMDSFTVRDIPKGEYDLEDEYPNL